VASCSRWTTSLYVSQRRRCAERGQQQRARARAQLGRRHIPGARLPRAAVLNPSASMAPCAANDPAGVSCEEVLHAEIRLLSSSAGRRRRHPPARGRGAHADLPAVARTSSALHSRQIASGRFCHSVSALLRKCRSRKRAWVLAFVCVHLVDIVAGL
jgi:hypothetical protein